MPNVVWGANDYFEIEMSTVKFVTIKSGAKF